MTTDWQALLDAFEHRLDEQWAALRDGGFDSGPPFAPPPVATPMPREHVARATALLQRCHELEAAIAAVMDDTSAEIGRLDATPAAPAEPVFFDSRV